MSPKKKSKQATNARPLVANIFNIPANLNKGPAKLNPLEAATAAEQVALVASLP